MDLTQLFKASVKTVRLRNKTAVFADKTRILKVKARDEFSIKANDIRYQITQLRDLLVENRAAYMRFGFHLKSSIQMTDDERNIIDKESEKIIILCNQYLSDLKVSCLKERAYYKQQVLTHQLAILDILANYLRDVFNMHNKQKENRIQHELETYRLLKLESNTSSDGACIKRDVLLDNRNQNTSQSNDVAIDEDQSDKFNIDYDNMTSDDIQLLESENTQLLNDLKGLSDEVDQIEKNVFGIARLQEIFTEKVTVQKYDIERIGNVVIGATENIKDANEQIKQAIQRNAGLRVWVLFFLIVMSFTLLFLDWYND
ncbi:syntaxin-18 [Contarinia nasturtii]|uniref:syntaxin-18 n=1 Tax=Contarinia nasturtii TaxID=265458 RepID=UPI0012D48B99|nr:syntaxin-18 [Contarinia nasturtii]